jgi:hypothetical protein
MNTTPKGLAIGVLAVALAAPSWASDHIDGVRTTADPAADLTDLFTFVSPKDPNRLVLIMNVHPVTVGITRFSDAVDYKFRIRPVTDPSTLTPSNDPRQEQSIVCTFSTGNLITGSQNATCTFNLGNGTDSIQFSTRGNGYRAGGDGERGGRRVFAGVRSDPWFLDLGKTLAFNNNVHTPDPTSLPGVNGLWGQNVLSIVVEVDKSELGGSVLAVTAQTVRK